MERSNRKFIKELRDNDKNKDSRIGGLETSEYSKIRFFTAQPAVLSTGIIAAGATYTSPDQRAFTSPNARGLFAVINGTTPAYGYVIYMGSSSDSPGAGYPLYSYFNSGGVITGSVVLTQFVMIPLGPDGKFKLVNSAGSGGNASMTITYIGWWE